MHTLVSDIRKTMLYSVLAGDESIAFPNNDEKKDNDDEQTREKREANAEEDKNEEEGNKVQMTVTKNLYGELDKRKFKLEPFGHFYIKYPSGACKKINE